MDKIRDKVAIHILSTGELQEQHRDQVNEWIKRALDAEARFKELEDADKRARGADIDKQKAIEERDEWKRKYNLDVPHLERRIVQLIQEVDRQNWDHLVKSYKELKEAVLGNGFERATHPHAVSTANKFREKVKELEEEIKVLNRRLVDANYWKEAALAWEDRWQVENKRADEMSEMDRDWETC